MRHAPDWLSFTHAGSPRGVGAAQGRLWRRARDAETGEWESLLGAARWVLRWGARPPASTLSWEDGRRFLLDVRRHFPHWAERSEALWRAAGTPRDWGSAIDPAAPAFGLRVVALDAGGIRCALPGIAATGDEARDVPGVDAWMVRDVKLEGGRRSLGVSPALWSAQVAGVNDAGLCGAVVVEAPLGGPRQGPTLALLPAWPLLDQALERCDRVERALRWCERRPGMGIGTLVFVDAAGDCGALRFKGDGRERIDPGEVLAAPVSAGPQIHLDPRGGLLRVEPGRACARHYAISIAPP